MPEQAGIDGVMVSEHIVLGPSASSAGLPANPREYALPGNQDPATPWPSPVVLLSAIAFDPRVTIRPDGPEDRAGRGTPSIQPHGPGDGPQSAG